jgi:hypothetical protein
MWCQRQPNGADAATPAIAANKKKCAQPDNAMGACKLRSNPSLSPPGICVPTSSNSSNTPKTRSKADLEYPDNTWILPHPRLDTFRYVNSSFSFSNFNAKKNQKRKKGRYPFSLENPVELERVAHASFCVTHHTLRDAKRRPGQRSHRNDCIAARIYIKVDAGRTGMKSTIRVAPF